MWRLRSLVAFLALAPSAAHTVEQNPLVYERISIAPEIRAGARPTMSEVIIQEGLRSRAAAGLGPGAPTVRGQRVQVDLDFLLPAAAIDTPESEKIQQHVRRSIYAMALRECDLLRERNANECRLHAIEVTVRRHPDAGAGYRVTGNMALAVIPK